MSHNKDIEAGSEKSLIHGGPLVRNITPGGHALDTSQPALPVFHRKFGDAAPLGLSAYALSVFVLSLINLGAGGVKVPAVVIAVSFFYGGLAQFVAGLWEFAVGNTFGATAFCSYASFWMSLGWVLSPWSGVSDAYGTDATEFSHAVGIYLFGWFVFTMIMLVGSLRSSIALITVFFTLMLTFLLLAISHFVPAHQSSLTIAGGVTGIISAFASWYTVAAGLLTPETSYFILPVGSMAKRD